MDTLHLTRELLRALADGTRNPGDLVSTVMSHLFDLCPTCANEFAAFKDEARSGEVSSYTPAFARVRAKIEAASHSVAAEKEGTGPKLFELLAMPHEKRLEAVRSTPSPYRGPALASMLLEATRERFRGRPQEALRLAELARAVLLHSDSSTVVTELYAQAVAYGGNAARVAGDKRGAAERFEFSRFLLRSVGGGDRRLQAEIDRFEGSLCYDLRDTERAKQLLHRAALVYFMEEDLAGAAVVLLKLGIAYNESGQQSEALEILGEALEILDPEEEPRIYLYCQHSLAICLSDSGEHLEAEQIVAANRARYEQYGDPLSLLRVAWVKGKIARGLGRYEEAEFHFLTARHGFQRAEIAYDVALVTLELAALYLEQRRTAEVKCLASELVGEFTRQRVSREAMAALMLFEDAAKLERVTPAFIGELHTYLMWASRDPSFAFQVAS